MKGRDERQRCSHGLPAAYQPYPDPRQMRLPLARKYACNRAPTAAHAAPGKTHKSCNRSNTHNTHLQLRMELLSQLWAAGIAAETMQRAAPSLSEQYAYAQVGVVCALFSGGSVVFKLRGWLYRMPPAHQQTPHKQAQHTQAHSRHKHTAHKQHMHVHTPAQSRGIKWLVILDDKGGGLAARVKSLERRCRLLTVSEHARLQRVHSCAGVPARGARPCATGT